MKKLIFLSLILLFPIFFVGCGQTVSNINEYDIKIVYNEDTQTLNCSQNVLYFNNSDNVMTCIPFFLYPNSFAEEVKTVSAVDIDKAYPNGKDYGNISFSDIKVDGKDVDINIEGKENCILSVELGKELYPDEKVEISMEYTVSLANINHRLGYGNNTINLGNFHPIACVYENGRGFVKNEFCSNGDPFYSDIANYSVVIEYPKDYVIASTGDGSTNEDGDVKVSSLNSLKTRDFCIVLSQRFKQKSKKIGETEVKYYYYDDLDPDHSLQVSCDAIETFSEMFGKYPYEQFSVVQANFVYGGMEYPNLVMISDEISIREDIDYVIVHETAHQWWYGLVGNNEFENAWQDESLTEYSTVLFFEEYPEYNLNYKQIISSADDVYKNFLSIFSKIYEKVDKSMTRSLNQFKTEPEYVNCVYVKGILMYDNIRAGIGEKKFLKCLKQYCKKFSYTNATPENLIAIFENTAGVKIENLFEIWLQGEEIVF